METGLEVEYQDRQESLDKKCLMWAEQKSGASGWSQTQKQKLISRSTCAIVLESQQTTTSTPRHFSSLKTSFNKIQYETAFYPAL